MEMNEITQILLLFGSFCLWRLLRRGAHIGSQSGTSVPPRAFDQVAGGPGEVAGAVDGNAVAGENPTEAHSDPGPVTQSARG